MNQKQALIPHLGMEQTVHACERDWKIGRLEISILEKFYQWVLPQLAPPFEALSKIIDKLPPALAADEFEKEKERRDAVLDWNSPLIAKYRETERGQSQMFLLLLQINHPEATLDDAFRLAAELGPERLEGIFSLAAGQAIPENPKNASGPEVVAYRPGQRTGRGSAGA